MGKMLKKILWFVLFLLVLLVAALMGGWGVHSRGWPSWLGMAVGAGIVGSFLFVLFLKKYLVRRRKKKFIEQIVDQEDRVTEEATPDLLQVRELEKTWNANLAQLRDSQLRSRGNPVYALPWYLALGATGTGKTSAISSFALPTSSITSEQEGQTTGTRNCDWWFMNKAVVLDVAGRYTVPVEGTGDQEEWKRFLSLLAKYRKREPLNGILIFISADVIREAAADLLKKQGQLLRIRIINLMRTIGYKIPVRVVVTKMDLVPGFLGFADSIDPSEHKQVMGYWNRRGNPFWQEVLDDVMRETGECLRDLRQKYVLERKEYHPDLLIFPENFEQLYQGLAAFFDPVFSENRLQETPYIAGVYFGSGRVAVSAHPSGREMTFSEEGKTFFLAEFFSRILADGRERLEPVKEYVLWRRMTRSLGLMSWWLFCFLCAGLVGISFLTTQNTLNIANEFVEKIDYSTEKPLGQDEFNASVLELEKLRRAIIKLEGVNDSNTLSNIHFSQAVKTEQKLKKRYCKSFETILQQPLEHRLARSINKMNDQTPDERFADYASFSVEYIYQLQKYLSEEPIKAISSSFGPAAGRILFFQDGTVSSEVTGSFADLNKHYLQWTEDRNTAAARLKILHSDLMKLLAYRIDDVSWLYHPHVTRADAVGLSAFWSHKILQRYNIFFVPGAFIEEGREKIHAFLEMTDEAMKQNSVASSSPSRSTGKGSFKKEQPSEKMLKALRKNFRYSYESAFFASWYNFAENFSLARKSLDKEQTLTMKEKGNEELLTEEDHIKKKSSPAVAPLIVEPPLLTEATPTKEKAQTAQPQRIRQYQNEKWREAAIRMAKGSNPYFNLIKRMAEELESFTDDKLFPTYGITEEKKKKVDPPPWAESVVAFDKIRQQAEKIREAEGKGLSATAAKVSSGLSKMKNAASRKLRLNKIGKDATGTGIGRSRANSVVSENNLAAAWNEYQKSLNALEATTPYKEKTFQEVSTWFRKSVNPGDEASLYGKAYRAVSALHGLAVGKYENFLAWRLIEGPFDFLTEFGLKESATVFQEQWMEQVVAQETMVDKNKKVGFLFDKEDGVVWKFVKGAGAPFLQETVHGYQSRDAFGRSLMLVPALYTFLGQGASVKFNRQADYRVKLSNHPMKVNKDATEEPYTSVITVQCADSEIVLENDNYPRTQIFTWSPDKCGDVHLAIEFPGLTLHKQYEGHMAFANFLNDFLDGALRFTSEDFPEQVEHLESMNIERITLTYSVSGQEEVLRLLELSPNVPKIISLPEQQHGEVIFN